MSDAASSSANAVGEQPAPILPFYDSGPGTFQKQQQQQLTLPSPEPPNNFQLPPKGKSLKASKLPSAIRHVSRKLAPPPLIPSCSAVATNTTILPPPYFIILEEGKDVPVFWNGEATVPLIKWGPSLDNEANHQQHFSTVEDFLSYYAAGRYLRKCSMSLQASSTKYINDLRMSDPFSKILDHQNKDGKPVTLLLTHVSRDEGESGYSKFTLYIRDIQGNKVFWNGSIPTNRLVAKLNQSDMSLTIENCLLNYVAKGYLSQNCQVDLVKECSDTIPRSSREELIPISLKAPVSSLFKGNSASIVVRNGSKAGNNNDGKDVTTTMSTAGMEDMSQFSATRIAIFAVPPPAAECNWVGMTWGEIKTEVRQLVSQVEVTMRDIILPTEVYANVVEKKRILETAIRRRSRVVDEVWRCFQALRNVHNGLVSGNRENGVSSGTRFRTPMQGSQVVVIGRNNNTGTGGDVDQMALQVHQSCIDFLSSSLIRYGLELEIYDEEAQGFNRVAGVGVGLAVVAVICTVVYYY